MEKVSESMPTPKICLLEKVLALNLSIPYYQRPYKWKAEKHVKQLLHDLEREIVNQTKQYRIGSLILHKETVDTIDTFNIVDGQQRLVTIALMIYTLGRLDEVSLFKEEFAHRESKNNIKYNLNFITEYFGSYQQKDREQFLNFLLKQCSVVVIILYSLPEAFQLFDSQNARGRELEPVDLLKAFHLREMKNNTEDEKKHSVATWEQSMNDGLLRKVVGNSLFQLRNWKRKEWKYYFTKDEIDEFKGINLNENNKHPFFYYCIHNSSNSYHKLEEPIINGKWFFDFIEHYVKMETTITSFLNDGQHGLVYNYKGAGRIGDIRLYELNKNLLFAFADKFGIGKPFEDYANEVYRWCYRARILKAQIRYETVLGMLRETNTSPLEMIGKWYRPDIKSMRRKMPLLGDSYEKQIDELIECIKKIEQP